MSDNTPQTFDDPRHAVIVRIIEEKLGVPFTAVENKEKTNLDTLKTIKEEVEKLIEQGTGFITELDEAIAKKEEDDASQKSKNAISIDLDDNAVNGKPTKKPPSSTRETKTGHFSKNDGKDRRPSDAGAATKSLNDISEENKSNATNKRPTTAKDAPKKPEKADKSVDKKSPPQKPTKSKEEKKTESKDNENADGQKSKRDDKDKKPVPPKAGGKGKEEKKTGGKNEEAKEEEPAHPANPELEALLTDVTASSITELKSVKVPSPIIGKTLQAIAQLVYGKPHQWDEVKTLLSDHRKFLKALPTIDAEKVSKKNLEAVQKIITDNDLTEEAATKSSAALGGLYKYLIATVKLADPEYKSPEEVERLDEETNPERAELKEILDKITDAVLAEAKQLKKTPDQLLKVFQASLELVQGKAPTWKEISQNYLSQIKPLRKVFKAPFETLPKKNVEGAQKIITEGNLNEESVRKVSPLGGEIYNWLVSAIKLADASYNSPEEVVRLQEEADRLDEENNPENPELKAILDEIQQQNLTETKAIRTVPDATTKTLQAISQLTHGKAPAWKDITGTYLQSTKALHKVLKIDFSNIPKENLEASKKIITDAKLTENKAKGASSTTASLYKWLIAAVKLADPEFKSPEEVAAEKAASGEAEAPAEESKTTTKKAGDKGKDAKKDTKKDDKPAPTPAKPIKGQPTKEEKKTAPKAANKKDAEANPENAEDAGQEKKDEAGNADKKAPASTPAKPIKGQPAKDDKKAAKAPGKKEPEANGEDKKKDKTADTDKKAPGATPAKPIKGQPAKEEKKATDKPASRRGSELRPENPEIKAALDHINKNVLTEMKSLPNPPAAVEQVAQILSLLTQGKTSDWKSLVKSHLTDLPTLHKALSVDYSKVSKKNVEAARKIIEDNKLTKDLLKTKSACASLLFDVIEVALRLADPTHTEANGATEASQQPTEEQTQPSTEEKTEENKTEETQAAQENPEVKSEEPQANHTEPEHKAEEQQNHETEHKPEVHLNGDQAAPHHEEKQEEAPAATEEVKAEPSSDAAAETTEHAATENTVTENAAEPTNHQNLNHDLSEVLGYDVSSEVNNGDVKEFISRKVKDYEAKISATSAHNDTLKAEGISEHPEKKPYEVKESTKGFIQMVEPAWIGELVQKPEWDEKISQILALFFAILGGSDVPDLNDKAAIRAYSVERLQREEGNLPDFLMSIEKHLDIPVERKIKIQEFLKDKAPVLNPNSFDSLDGLCGVISFLMKETTEYLGVQPIENVKKASAKEKVYLLNEEKYNYYNEKQNKLIEVAHKNSIPLDS